jgi:hypothetical protein
MTMKRPVFALLLAAFITLGTLIVSAQGPEKPRQGFLSALKEGQSVSLKEVAGRSEITFDEAVPDISHKIVKIGPDSVAVEDIGGLIETTIPVYSIKSIVRLKVPK